MRKIVTKIALVLLNVFLGNNINAQNEIIWGQKNLGVPENFDSTGQYYYKDVNNYLNNFIGTWEYVNGNEKFQIILTKITKYHFVYPDINVNIFQDGIAFKYKQFKNGVLFFESPIQNYPNLYTMDGDVLDGMIIDYGRITKPVYELQTIGGGLVLDGGSYFRPQCYIERVLMSPNQTPKIMFNLYLREGFGQYDNPIYSGQATFSIPNNIILTKQ